MIDEKLIRQALQTVLHPKLNRSLVDIGMVRNISINDDVVTLTLALKTDHSPLKKVFINEIEKAVGGLPQVSSVKVQVATLSKDEFDQFREIGRRRY